MSKAWTFHNPVRVRFGSGSRAQISDIVDTRRLLIVTTVRGRRQIESDPVMSGAIGKAAAVTWVDTIAPNPGLQETQAEIDRLAGTGFDMLLAFGGGSAMDAAKALAAGLAPRATSRNLATLIADPDRHLAESCLPILAVPTTSGTGAEVTPFATIWNHVDKKKLSLTSPHLFPHTAIVDPELTRGLPRDPTLSTGLDALNQAFESVWNRHRTPLTLGMSGRAIGLALGALPRLSRDLSDVDARSDMAQASLLAGLTISQTRTAICHSISYPLTAHFGLSHGWACATTMGAIARLVLEEEPGVLKSVSTLAGFSTASELVDRLHELLVDLDVRSVASAKVQNSSKAIALIPQMFTPGRSDNFIVDMTPEKMAAVLAESIG